MNIIVVDDESAALWAMERAIKKVVPVLSIASFPSPQESLDYAKENMIDIAFLDIEMPDMTGIEMAKRLKIIQPKTNIVFITGHSHYAAEAFDVDASDFVLKPVTVERIERALLRLRNPVLKSASRIRVQTFGKFEIFADDEPIKFGRAKAKELLAYLIEKKGTGVTKKELASVLWEDGEYNRNRQKNLQTFVSEMMKALKAVDADQIIIKKRDSLSVDKTKFDCDFYRYLAGDPTAFNMYMGEFMVEYSWAEFTNASLTMGREEN